MATTGEAVAVCDANLAGFERSQFGLDGVELGRKLFDGVDKDRKQVVAGVTQLVAVTIINNDAVLTFESENVLGKETVVNGTGGFVRLTFNPKLVSSRLEGSNKVKTVGDRGEVGFVTGVGDGSPSHLNVGVSDGRGAYHDTITFATCDIIGRVIRTCRS